MKKVWMKNPHSGGMKIAKDVQKRTQKRIEEYAAKNYAGQYTRLDIRQYRLKKELRMPQANQLILWLRLKLLQLLNASILIHKN